MATFPLPSALPVRRLILTGGFVVVAATVPTIATLSSPAPATSVAQCQSGEEEDTFTTTCTPFMVPRQPGGFTTTAANPDVPEIGGIPCIGHDSGACVGLAENQADAGPQPIPQSTISSSP